MEIDLNADLGEGAGFDAELMPLITSANVCCGFHAGDPDTIQETLELARKHGVIIGAHPGYPDREHFGRRDSVLHLDQLRAHLPYQIGALDGLARANDRLIHYVKPHGALYNQACQDMKIAKVVIEVLQGLIRRPPVFLVGLPGSWLERFAGLSEIPFIPEGFADRRYRPDGSLVPRTEPDAFVHDPQEAVSQVEWLIREKGVRTICVHGDNPEAVAFARAVRESLLQRGFTLKPFA